MNRTKSDSYEFKFLASNGYGWGAGKTLIEAVEVLHSIVGIEPSIRSLGYKVVEYAETTHLLNDWERNFDTGVISPLGEVNVVRSWTFSPAQQEGE